MSRSIGNWMSAALLAAAAIGTQAAPVLTVETDNATNNMFAVGKAAAATFGAKGWSANESRQVVADIFDYRNEKVGTLTAELKADANGTGSVRVALPTDRHGFFRVRAKAGDLALPKLGTRPAGEFTYGVTVDPKDRPDIPQERAFMGIHGEAAGQGRWMGAHQGFASYALTEEGFRKMQAANAANPWKRWGFANINISSHIYDFVTWSNKGALSPASEQWVIKHRNDMTWKAFTTEEGRAFYREWIALKVNAYRKYMHTPGKRIYEIFWEPDLTAPDKKTMVDAAEFAAKLIKEIDPEGLVALPTISNCSHLGWHRELFELGILKYGDVFDLHPYTAYPPEPNGYLDNIRALKRMLAEYGRPDMPFICTESGYQTSATQEGERLQLDGQVRVQLMLLGEGIWFNCPFYGTDYGGDRDDHREGDYGLTYNLDYPKPRFGARHISPRPAFCGLAAFSMLLDGWKARESVECLGETVLGYVYTNGTGRATAALWDFGGTDQTVRLPVGRPEIELADVMGNRFTRKTDDGTLALKLSTSPVYVFDPDLASWDRGMKGYRDAAAAAARAKEMAPVKVTAASAAFAGTEPAASVTVVNNTDAARTLSVSTRIVGEPDARQAVKVAFAPHETKAVRVPMPGFRPNPFKLFKLEAAAFDAEAHRAEIRREVNFLSADYVPGVGRDASVGDWAGVRRQPVPFTTVQNDCSGANAFQGEKDLSAEIGFGWNEDFLLIDALVKDDAYRQDQTGWWTWNGDAIQFGFAKARLEHLTANDYTDSLAQGTTEIDFALTKNGPEGYRTISFDPYKWPTDVHGKGQIDPKECPMSVEKTEVAGGIELRYRIALPWRYMNKTEGAKAGEQVFVSATFNDRDPGDKVYTAIPMFELKRMAPRHFGAVYLNAQ